jgi:cytochrome o ubiquinol oxidase subunit II
MFEKQLRQDLIMSGKKSPLLHKSFLLIVVILLAVIGLTACHSNMTGMLTPKGPVANEELKLFFDVLALMLIVVLPVIIMSFAFVFHFRASHRNRDYKPNLGHNFFLESLWWGIPCVIIIILAIMTGIKTHELDPYKKVAGFNDPPLLIQAIALPWKWLFIYPEQGIATVNYLEIPVGRQIEFWTTTDNVPMSALFIPELGSQIYTMAGMRTRLHLVATQTGEFVGMNTLFNGDGFSDMRFVVHAVPADQMQQWLNQIKTTATPFTDAAYNELLKPSVGDAPKFFVGAPGNFFQNVVDLYVNSSGAVHPRANQANYSSKG